MRYKRGNVQRELDMIEKSMLTELELRNITTNHLKKAIEKIGLNKKEVPKIGRPKIPIEVKRQRNLKMKLEQEQSLGILRMFH